MDFYARYNHSGQVGIINFLNGVMVSDFVILMAIFKLYFLHCNAGYRKCTTSSALHTDHRGVYIPATVSELQQSDDDYARFNSAVIQIR